MELLQCTYTSSALSYHWHSCSLLQFFYGSSSLHFNWKLKLDADSTITRVSHKLIRVGISSCRKEKHNYMKEKHKWEADMRRHRKRKVQWLAIAPTPFYSLFGAIPFLSLEAGIFLFYQFSCKTMAWWKSSTGWRNFWCIGVWTWQLKEVKRSVVGQK